MEFKNISVIFTSPRYNSPGSIFGHTFLRLNTTTIPYAINYAAIVPKNINNIIYAYKGINGYFKSRYKLLPYARKDYEYRYEEARDLLEFKINLSKDQMENILFHLYEIKDVTQNYYFLSRNCSSELLKLLDLADENINLTSQLSTRTVPIDIIYMLDSNNLLNKPKRYISKIKIFYNLTKKLSSNNLKMIKNIANGNMAISEFKNNKNIDNKTRDTIILATIKYIEIKALKNSFDQKAASKLFRLTQLEIKYKIKSKYNDGVKLKRNPITNKTHKLYIGTRIQDKNKEQLIGYRYLYSNKNDLINDDKGYGTIELLDIALRYKEDKLTLEKLLLLNLEAQPPSNNFFLEPTVSIQLGSKRLSYFNDNLYSYIDYAKGINYQIKNNFFFRTELGLGFYRYDKDMYRVKFRSSFEYSYKNKFISELMYNICKYNDKILIKELILNTHIKIKQNSKMTISIKNTKYNKSFNAIEIDYNYMF